MKNTFWDLATVKVQLFWENQKNVLNRPYGFEIYLVNIWEKLNFTTDTKCML